jgi:signal peptidase I
MYPGHLKVTVPEGYMYVMGDHRNLSKDSREFGFVREDAVLGKVLLRFYPFDKFGTVN